MHRFIKHLSPRPSLWALLLFLVVPLLAFPELVFGQKTLFWTDLTWIHFPRHLFAAEEWLAGRVPLWDPYEDTGLPLLAETQVGVLYPLSVLFLSSLRPSLELSLFILIHFTLAAIFTYLLARSLGQGPAAATLAGLALGCGGFLMAQVPNLNIMTGAVWLPLILYAAIQTTRSRTWLAAMLAGIPLAWQILTAQPQIVVYSLVIVVGYGLYRIWTDFFGDDSAIKGNLRYGLRTGLLLAVAILTGLLLAAPQLLPTIELQQLSTRAQERGLDFLTENSLPPIMLLNLVLPGAFGNNVVGFKGGDPFQEVFIYAGFLPLILALFSWRRRHQGDTWFFWLLLLGTLLLALGRYTPLYRYLIQYLPGLDLFRIPSRWLMGLNLALAILAGAGLDSLRRKGLPRFGLVALWITASVILIALLLLWFFRAELLAWSVATLREDNARLVAAYFNKGFNLDPTYRERLLGSLLGLRIPVVLLLTNLVIAVALFSLLASRHIERSAFAVAVIIVTSLDLIAAGGTTINPTRPDDWWWQLSGGARYVLEHEQGARVFPLGMGSEEATVSHLGQYFPSVHRIRSAGGHGSSLRIARYDTFLNEADPVQAIQVMGVGHLLTLGQMGADTAATYPLVYNDDNSFVYANQAPLPRMFIVHEAIQTGSPEEALAHFQVRSIDPRRTVILEAQGQAPTLPPSSAPANSTATIINQHPQLVEIEASLSSAGYLVLLDTYYPGWVATVDRQRTPIYRANYIGRAVYLPPGQHIVRFEFRPLTFRGGLLLAALTLVSMGSVAFVGMGRRLG